MRSLHRQEAATPSTPLKRFSVQTRLLLLSTVTLIVGKFLKSHSLDHSPFPDAISIDIPE
jgi:hypothetical protein